MLKKPIVVGVIGKSGCGKTSLCLDLKDMYGDLIHLVKSKTTREERIWDPNDKESHIFCTMDDFNQHTAVAIYNSPKGYLSWTDESCFEQDKINLYCIDPVAFKNELNIWCEHKDIICYGIYLGVDESVRKRRYIQREKTMDGYDIESHLSLKHLQDTYNVMVVDASGSRQSTLLQVEELIKEVIHESSNSI